MYSTLWVGAGSLALIRHGFAGGNAEGHIDQMTAKRGGKPLFICLILPLETVLAGSANFL